MEGRSHRMKAAGSDYHNHMAAGTDWSDKAAVLSSLPYNHEGQINSRSLQNLFWCL